MQTLIDGFLHHAPTAALLIFILVVGLILARVIRRLALWAVERTGLVTLAEKLGVSRLLYAVGIRAGLGQVIAKVAYWTVVLAMLVVAAEVMGLDGVSEAIGRVVAYLPQVLIAGVILIAGARIAEWARALLLQSNRKRGLLDAPQTVARLVYYAVIVISVTFAADQLGLETALINSLILIVVAAMAFGGALALALAARSSLSGVVARFYASQLYKPGDRVRVGESEVEGVVLRFAATSMAIQTDAGAELMVPCGTLLERVITLERRPPPSASSEPEATETPTSTGDSKK